jgi:hypothetical protein
MITASNVRLLPSGGDDGWYGNMRIIEERLAQEGRVLQWAIVRSRMVSGCPVVDVEATILDESLPFRISFNEKIKNMVDMPGGSVFMHIVPTGIRAAVGGSLGDAMPVNLALSRLGLVVTHPNTCNGGPVNMIESDPADRILYVEGFGLDQFALGNVYLERVKDRDARRGKTRKIGIVADCGSGNEKLMDKIHNAVFGFWSNGGADIVGLQFTKKPVGGRAFLNRSGSFGGEVRNWSEVRIAAEKLIAGGAEAIAPFTFIEVRKRDAKLYFKSKLPNPWGRDEALISHPLVGYFGLPVAHAPQLLFREEKEAQNHGRVNPASGMEASVPFYAFSVLIGLKYAPSFISAGRGFDNRGNLLSFDRVSAVICPATSMGGIPMIRAEQKSIPIIGVIQSDTVLRVRGCDLGFQNTIEVETYLDALGLLKITKNEGREFTVKKMRETLRKRGKHLREIGERVCREADVVPATLLRPLVAPV